MKTNFIYPRTHQKKNMNIMLTYIPNLVPISTLSKKHSSAWASTVIKYAWALAKINTKYIARNDQNIFKMNILHSINCFTYWIFMMFTNFSIGVFKINSIQGAKNLNHRHRRVSRRQTTTSTVNMCHLQCYHNICENTHNT